MNQENVALTPASFSLPPAGSQAPVVYTGDQRMRTRNVRQHYKSKCVRGMSITLIVLGCLCFLVQFIDIFLGSSASAVGTGIWAGIIFIITGALGVVSSRKRTTCIIVAFLVMSIIGAVIAIAPLTAGTMSWILGYFRYNYRFYIPYDYERHGTRNISSYYPIFRASIAMNAIMVFAAITNGLLLIISAGLACHGLCPDENAQSGASVLVAGQVQYITGSNGQQQMVILPMTQPIAGGSHIPASNGPSMTTVMPGQQIVITNPTSAGQTVYVQPSDLNASAPPAYDDQANPPEYETKQPLPV